MGTGSAGHTEARARLAVNKEDFSLQFGTRSACGAAMIALGSLFALDACSSGDSSTSVPRSRTDAGGDATCSLEPGQLAMPSCTNPEEQCVPPPEGGLGTPCNAASPCLAMADNSDKSVVDLRIRKLNVLAPPALTQLYFQQD